MRILHLISLFYIFYIKASDNFIKLLGSINSNAINDTLLLTLFKIPKMTSLYDWKPTPDEKKTLISIIDIMNKYYSKIDNQTDKTMVPISQSFSITGSIYSLIQDDEIFKQKYDKFLKEIYSGELKD
eukprot:GHVP01040231.1.p1 GENE.GHVP01040231.1~~GHVP01040231.1.p1  ORF type:complete len:127 (-),score=13.43 GHVP01040231.1:570-950(-)